MTQLSDADLNYCVAHGVINKWDGMFIKSSRNCTPTGWAGQRVKQLSDKLVHYAGIAARSSVMKEKCTSRSQEMRRFKEAARITYINHNKINNNETDNNYNTCYNSKPGS